MKNKFVMDEIDKNILRGLQKSKSGNTAELAANLGMNAASCWRRLERMEELGLIAPRQIEIDPRALGLSVEVSLRVTLDKTRTDAFDRFIASARKVPEVNEIQTFLGRVDVRLNVLARDMDHYQEIYRDRILALPHIADIEALMLVANVKTDEKLPI